MSDELGHLVAGQHKAGRGREALLHLLGPAFVGRHLRLHWKGDNYDQRQNEEQRGRLLTSKELDGRQSGSQSGRLSGSQSGRVKYLRSGRMRTSRSRAQSTSTREWSAKHIRVREDLKIQGFMHFLMICRKHKRRYIKYVEKKYWRCSNKHRFVKQPTTM